MLRIDPSVTPTMAKAPTLGQWELELLRTIENVVRLGHRSGAPRRLELEDGTGTRRRRRGHRALAAYGLKIPPRCPIWRPEEITLQSVRAGFPCFGGRDHRLRRGDPARRRREEPPLPAAPFGNTRRLGRA